MLLADINYTTIIIISSGSISSQQNVSLSDHDRPACNAYLMLGALALGADQNLACRENKIDVVRVYQTV